MPVEVSRSQRRKTDLHGPVLRDGSAQGDDWLVQSSQSTDPASGEASDLFLPPDRGSSSRRRGSERARGSLREPAPGRQRSTRVRVEPQGSKWTRGSAGKTWASQRASAATPCSRSRVLRRPGPGEWSARTPESSFGNEDLEEGVSRDTSKRTLERDTAPRCSAPSKERRESGARSTIRRDAMNGRSGGRTRPASITARPTKRPGPSSDGPGSWPVEQSQGSTCDGAVAGRGGPAPALGAPDRARG